MYRFALNQDLGFVAPDEYADPNITCHKAATPGTTYIPVTAGDKIDLQWSPWPDSHKGPVLDYLARCNGDCTKVNKNHLTFFKIDAGGLVSDSSPPGTWASDQLIANNNTWTVKVSSYPFMKFLPWFPTDGHYRSRRILSPETLFFDMRLLHCTALGLKASALHDYNVCNFFANCYHV